MVALSSEFSVERAVVRRFRLPVDTPEPAALRVTLATDPAVADTIETSSSALRFLESFELNRTDTLDDGWIELTALAEPIQDAGTEGGWKAEEEGDGKDGLVLNWVSG